MRIIDSAAATGSTEINLPSAPSAVAPTRPVAPTLGDPGRPGRPSGLGAPLMSGVAPAVPRSVSRPQSPVPGPVESGTSVQRTSVVGTEPPPGTTPEHTSQSSAEAAAAVDEPAGDVADPAVAPTLGVKAHETPEARGGDGDAHEVPAPLPQLPLAGAAPVPRLDAGPSVQRLGADSTPAAPLMVAPLLGDTSPYRSTPMHPAVPAAPGVSAGPVLPAISSGPAVQRFGLPGASSLLDSAKKSVGGLANSAQGAVGGLMNSAGGYVNQAQGAAGGLMNSAGGYANQAQQAAGGYLN